MIIEFSSQSGFRIIHMQQENIGDTDFSQIEGLVEKCMLDGNRKVALSMGINVYPYSKLISVLIRCSAIVLEHGGKLAVVQPNPDFLEVLKRTRLEQVFAIASSESDLENLV
jgi:hypothetical protein